MQRDNEEHLNRKKHLNLFLIVVGILIVALPIYSFARNINHGHAFHCLKEPNGKSLTTEVQKMGNDYAYCLERLKPSPSGDLEQKTELVNKDVWATLKYGYPNQSWYSGGSAEQLNFYVTQVAVWSFIYGWDDNYIRQFTQTGADSKNLVTDTATLVNNIIKLRHQATDDENNLQPSLKFEPNHIEMHSKPGEGVQSDFITVTGYNIKGNADIALSGAPAGTKILNESGQVTNSIPIGGKFRFEIPNTGGGGSFSFSVTGKGETIRAVKYETPSNTQNVAVLEPIAVTTPASTNGTVNWNTPVARSSVKLMKINAENKKPLPGATFALYQNGKEVDRQTSGNDGVVTFNDKEVGTYQVKEISAPKGYVVDSNMHDVTFEKDKVATLEMPNKPVHATVRLFKLDSDTHKPLIGAEFILKQNGVEKYRAVSNDRGVAIIKDVKFGDYELTEVKAPTGYNILPKTKVININKDGDVIRVDIPNKIIEGDVKIVKVDKETKKPIKGAEFGIYQGDKQINKGITADDGTIMFTKLKFGKYTIKELKPAVGYNPTTKTWDVDIKEQGKLITVNVENDPIKGKIQLVKIDANHEEKPVKGAKFRVFKNEDLNTAVDDITTDENGFAYTKDLRFGDYVIQEYDAPTSYYINDKQYPVSVKEHNKIVVQYVVNNPVEFRLKVVKTDNEENKPLVGATFQIQKDGKPVEFEYQLDSKVVKENKFITNKEGLILLPKELGSGTYSLVELDAPKGYTKAKPVEFTIDRNTKFDKDELGNIFTVEVKDEVVRGNVILTKTDFNSKPLEGVEFELYSKKDDNPNKHVNKFIKLLSDVKDKVSSILPGDNKEVEKTNEHEGVEVKENISEKDKANAPEDSKDVNKQDSKEETKSESKELKKEDSKEENSLDSKDNNKDLVNSKEKDIKVSEEDKKLIESLKASENLLKDKIKEEKDKDILVGKFKTDKEGHIVVKDLKYGQYYFKEVKTKEDFILDYKQLDFNIEAKDQVAKVSMQNAKMGVLELTKVDVSTGKVLPNATFAIHSEKEVIMKGKTDKDGKATFKLKPGKYFYQEIEAPSGYKLDDRKFPFEIKPTGDIIKCRMTNVPIPVIPQTGDNSTRFLLPCISLGVVGLGFLALRFRKY